MAIGQLGTEFDLPLRRALEAMKIAALTNGTRISTSALEHLGGAEQLTIHEYSTTGGIPLRVAGLDINVPFDEWYSDSAELFVDLDGGVLTLEHLGVKYAVDTVYPLPAYTGQQDSQGNSFVDVVYTHIDRFRLSPITGCAYDCAFCDLPGRVRMRPIDQLLEGAEAALNDDSLPLRHALISGGSPGPRDEAAFGDLIVDVVRRLSPRIEIDVMMSSGPYGPELVRRLVDAGAHGFALNIEIESTSAAELHIRGKQRRARPHYDATVAAAVELVGAGSGRVRSLILPGLESVESTLQGVEHISRLGADPVLSPFRPAQGTRLSDAPVVAQSLLREVLDGSREIVARHGVALGPRCLPCQHNTLTFPWDVPAT